MKIIDASDMKFLNSLYLPYLFIVANFTFEVNQNCLYFSYCPSKLLTPPRLSLHMPALSEAIL
jgi:hypothetical protein